MPVPMLKTIADDANVSIAKAEESWNKAKNIVNDEYSYAKSDDRYWKLVTGITKKMLGVTEALQDTPYALEQQASAAHMIHHLIKENVLEDNWIIINEATGLTYYELRQFMTLLLKNTNGPEAKKVLDSLLKTLGKLEMMNKPTPAIAKLKAISPSIF